MVKHNNKCASCGRKFLNEGCGSCIDYCHDVCSCNDCYGYEIDGCGKEITNKGFVFR